MTYNELKTEVAQLGFSRVIEDENALYTVATRALSALFLERGQKSVARIPIIAPKLTNVYKTVSVPAGETVSLQLVGTAFSFKPLGNGAYTQKDGNERTRVNFSASDGAVKGIIKTGECELTISADEDLTVLGLASFLGSFGSGTKSIPVYEESYLIDPSEHIKDFRSLAGPVTRENGQIETQVGTCGNHLTLPFLYGGTLVITYYRTPRAILRTGEDIDLPRECEPLYPLLVSAYLWLDDDSDKAQYYMALYRDGIARLEKSDRSAVRSTYVTNGWA